MNRFTYSRADDVAAAVREAASDGAAKFIAGGTNLLDLMKENVERPNRLIDINRLPLAEIRPGPDGGLRLGALVTNTDVAYHPEVERRYPLVSKAILSGASQQLRNMATTGGNLMQRTRCVYFYDTATPCNKREPGTGCSAITGLNKNHAILGTSEHCIATHPSDMCVALVALDAVVQVTGPGGDRAIPIADFHRLPGDTPQRDTNLAAGEIITAVDLPARGFPEHHTYLKVRERTSYASARPASRWAASPTSRGATARPRRCCTASALPGTPFGRSPRRSCATRGVSATTTSRSSWRSAPSSAP